MSSGGGWVKVIAFSVLISAAVSASKDARCQRCIRFGAFGAVPSGALDLCTAAVNGVNHFDNDSTFTSLARASGFRNSATSRSITFAFGQCVLYSQRQQKYDDDDDNQNL